MQFDRMRIAVRERRYTEILDLALAVIRAHALPLLVLSLLGTAPFVALNHWLLGPLLDNLDYEVEWFNSSTFGFLFWYVILVMWQMPLASCLVTLYLGQVMFEDSPNWRQLRRDLFGSLPQLFVLQVVARALMILFVISIFVLYVAAPYLNEVILLERNPLFSRRHQAGTIKRCRRLHEFNLGDLFARWISALAIGSCWVLVLWAALRWTREVFTGHAGIDERFYTVLFPLSLWTVSAFFHVVRYLSYLDLRIRTEGWEVELLLKAEAAKLNRQMMA